ncbi:LysR family transcriptional regulator [Thermicanus aegyptius]|uniref:LysR family transcriptional regulator n=1 Tax=Thermicanus aegyptius TaxID=94009 RepID=UPI00041308A1|nr:LysR family transcriptional regulator [Thermicanus aegyptius]
MNLQQLRVFVTLARKRSLTAVAAELHLRQPTVSFHVKKLEEELGVALFQRKNRYFRLTDAGEDLLPYARRMIALEEEAEQRMKEYREQGRGKLKIGASYTPATYFLPTYLESFQKQFPNILPLLTVKKAGTILEMLKEYEVDVAVISLSDEKREGMEIIPLIEDELKLLLSTQHPLAEKEKITIEDLQDESFLIHEKGSTSRELSEAWAKENGLQWNVRMELGAIETIKESVKHNIGIGILPKRSVERDIALGELVMRDLPGYVNRRYISLAYRKGDETVFPAKKFIEFLKKSVENGTFSP